MDTEKQNSIICTYFGRTIPEAGQKWQHFKGHVYKIICIASHTEEVNPMVIYQDVNTMSYWARPLWMFMSEVDHKKYPDVKQKYRFEQIPF